MAEKDEDALVCDFAEYYGIYDYTALPLSKAGILAWGLPERSRIKLLLAEEPASLDIVLMAAMVDRLSYIAWTKTKDAEKGKNKPKSILDSLYKKKEKANNKGDKPTSYSTIEEYEKARKELIDRIQSKG